MLALVFVLLILSFQMSPQWHMSNVVAGGSPNNGPQSIQTGYDSSYTGAGIINQVYVYYGAPSLSGVGWADTNYINLDTGNLYSCSGFMQDVLMYRYGGWSEMYMNGDSGCYPSSYPLQLSPQPTTGHRIFSYIGNLTANTGYEFGDITNGQYVSTQVSSIGTWNYNTFEAMTEIYSAPGTIGTFSFDTATIVDGSGGYHYVGGAQTATPSQYGSACASSNYNLGAWDNTNHGYQESSITIQGRCTVNILSSGHTTYGVVNNDWQADGGPNGNYAEIYGGNPGDGGWIKLKFWDPYYTGTLQIYAYSASGYYNSHVIVKVSIDGSSWSTLGSVIVSSTSPSWISVGSLGLLQGVKYVNVTAVDDQGYSADVFLGAVCVHW